MAGGANGRAALHSAGPAPPSATGQGSDEARREGMARRELNALRGAALDRDRPPSRAGSHCRGAASVQRLSKNAASSVAMVIAKNSTMATKQPAGLTRRCTLRSTPAPKAKLAAKPAEPVSDSEASSRTMA